MGIGFQICKMKGFRDLFHNNVNVLDTAEMCKMVDFM